MRTVNRFLSDHPGAAIIDWVGLTGILFVAVVGGYVGTQVETTNATYSMTAGLEAVMEPACEAFAAQASCND